MPKSRQENNLLILAALEDLVWKYPDIRFCQLLTNLNLDRDRFHEEPDVTLKAIEQRAGEIQDGNDNNKTPFSSSKES